MVGSYRARTGKQLPPEIIPKTATKQRRDRESCHGRLGHLQTSCDLDMLSVGASVHGGAAVNPGGASSRTPAPRRSSRATTACTQARPGCRGRGVSSTKCLQSALMLYRRARQCAWEEVTATQKAAGEEAVQRPPHQHQARGTARLGEHRHSGASSLKSGAKGGVAQSGARIAPHRSRACAAAHQRERSAKRCNHGSQRPSHNHKNQQEARQTGV
jgi:hypothetical protein